MINADMTLIFPYDQDYPLFRKVLRKIRNKVRTVSIFFSEHHSGKHIDEFVRKSLAGLDVNFFEVGDLPICNLANDGWANIAVNTLFRNTSSEWFLKIHPDFFARDWDSFFETIEGELQEDRLIGYSPNMDAIPNDFVLPVFHLMRRSYLERTSLNFAPGPGHDHWGRITLDARDLGMEVISLEMLGLQPRVDYIHIAGVTYDFTHGLEDNFTFPNPEKALCFFYWTLNCGEPMEQEWETNLRKIIERLKLRLPGFDPEKYWLSEIVRRSVFGGSS